MKRHAITLAITLTAVSVVLTGCKKSEPQEPPAVPEAAKAVESAAADTGGQTVCPVMGGKVQKDCFTEYKGKKVYFCCPGCKDKFTADPDKYLSKLPQFTE
jgi:YHS domain-containing protein